MTNLSITRTVFHFRTEGVVTNFADLNDRIGINRFGLQNIELKMEEFIQQTNERLDSLCRMLQEILAKDQSSMLRRNSEKFSANMDRFHTNATESQSSPREVTSSLPDSMKPKASYGGGSMTPLKVETAEMEAEDWKCNKEGTGHLQDICSRQDSTDSASRRKRAVSECGGRLSRETKRFPFTSFLPIKPAYTSSVSPPVSTQTRTRLVTMNLPFRDREYFAITDHIEPHLLMDDSMSESSAELQSYFFHNQETSTSSEMFKGEVTKVEAYNEIFRQKMNSETIVEPNATSEEPNTVVPNGARGSITRNEIQFEIGDGDEADLANTSSEDQNDDDDCASASNVTAPSSSEDENEEVARVVSNSLNILQESMNRGLFSKCRQAGVFN